MPSKQRQVNLRFANPDFLEQLRELYKLECDRRVLLGLKEPSFNGWLLGEFEFFIKYKNAEWSANRERVRGRILEEAERKRVERMKKEDDEFFNE